MNGMCKVLDCYFGAQLDPGNDEWVAIQVYRDGNPITLGRFPTEEEAEEHAGRERDAQIQRNPHVAEPFRSIVNSISPSVRP